MRASNCFNERKRKLLIDTVLIEAFSQYNYKNKLISLKLNATILAINLRIFMQTRAKSFYRFYQACKIFKENIANVLKLQIF